MSLLRLYDNDGDAFLIDITKVVALKRSGTILSFVLKGQTLEVGYEDEKGAKAEMLDIAKTLRAYKGG